MNRLPFVGQLRALCRRESGDVQQQLSREDLSPKPLRAPVRQRDLELNDKARRWLSQLPAEVRPTALSQRFPRIANRLATLWRDEGLIDYTLADLMTDTRGGRKGFPGTVAGELQMLCEFHVVKASADGNGDQIEPETLMGQLQSESKVGDLHSGGSA